MPLVSFPHAGSLLVVSCGTGVWEWFFFGGGELLEAGVISVKTP